MKAAPDVLSTLPAGATILSARLRVYEFANNGSSQYSLEAHKISQDWTEPGADWQTADGATPWTGGDGGSYDPAVLDTEVVNESPAAWREWDLTTLVQEWVDGVSPDYGVQLIHDPVAAGNWAEFESRESSAGNPPELFVAYEP